MTITAEGLPTTSETDGEFKGKAGNTVVPSPRRGLESTGIPIRPLESAPAELFSLIDIASVAPEIVNTDDEPVFRGLAVLAIGSPVRIMRAVEFVRAHPARAARMRDAAALHDVAREVLTAALAIQGRHMEQHPIKPTAAAQRALMQSALYSHRHNALAHAITRDEVALAARSHNYTLIGGLAVLAAGEAIPPWHEIFPSSPRIQLYEPVE